MAVCWKFLCVSRYWDLTGRMGWVGEGGVKGGEQDVSPESLWGQRVRRVYSR